MTYKLFRDTSYCTTYGTAVKSDRVCYVCILPLLWFPVNLWALGKLLEDLLGWVSQILASTNLRCLLRRVTDGSASKESACSARDTEDEGSVPGSGRFPGRRHGSLLQYSLENLMDRGAWWTTAHWIANSWTWVKWLSMHAIWWLFYLMLFFKIKTMVIWFFSHVTCGNLSSLTKNQNCAPCIGSMES